MQNTIIKTTPPTGNYLAFTCINYHATCAHVGTLPQDLATLVAPHEQQGECNILALITDAEHLLDAKQHTASLDDAAKILDVLEQVTAGEVISRKQLENISTSTGYPIFGKHETKLLSNDKVAYISNVYYVHSVVELLGALLDYCLLIRKSAQKAKTTNNAKKKPVRQLKRCKHCNELFWADNGHCQYCTFACANHRQQSKVIQFPKILSPNAKLQKRLSNKVQQYCKYFGTVTRPENEKKMSADEVFFRANLLDSWTRFLSDTPKEERFALLPEVEQILQNTNGTASQRYHALYDFLAQYTPAC